MYCASTNEAQHFELIKECGNRFAVALYFSLQLRKVREKDKMKRSHALIMLCLINTILIGWAPAVSSSWYEEVPRSEPVYAWMQEIGSIKLTWGIVFSEYAKPQPISKLQFVRDVISVVDALRLVLERLREKAPLADEISLEEACSIVGLPVMKQSDVSRLSTLTRALIGYFADDINHLSTDEKASDLLAVVKAFEEEVCSFVGKFEQSTTKANTATKLPSLLFKNLSRETTKHTLPSSVAEAQITSVRKLLTANAYLMDEAPVDGFDSDIIVAYWLGEGRVSLSNTMTTTIPLPFMLLQVCNRQTQMLTQGDAINSLTTRVSIPFGERWRIVGRYSHTLPTYDREITISDLLRYSRIEIGGQYDSREVSVRALYTRFGGRHFEFLSPSSLWHGENSLHGIALGVTWRSSTRLHARYSFQMLSSIDGRDEGYRVHTGEAVYNLNAKWGLAVGVQRTIALLSSPIISTDAVVGVRYSISPQAELRLLYQVSDYNSKQIRSQEETTRLQFELHF